MSRCAALLLLSAAVGAAVENGETPANLRGAAARRADELGGKLKAALAAARAAKRVAKKAVPGAEDALEAAEEGMEAAKVKMDEASEAADDIVDSMLPKDTPKDEMLAKRKTGFYHAWDAFREAEAEWSAAQDSKEKAAVKDAKKVKMDEASRKAMQMLETGTPKDEMLAKRKTGFYHAWDAFEAAKKEWVAAKKAYETAKADYKSAKAAVRKARLALKEALAARAARKGRA